MLILLLTLVITLSQQEGSKCTQLFNNDALISLEPLSLLEDFKYKLSGN